MTNVYRLSILMTIMHLLRHITNLKVLLLRLAQRLVLKMYVVLLLTGFLCLFEDIKNKAEWKLEFDQM